MQHVLFPFTEREFKTFDRAWPFYLSLSYFSEVIFKNWNRFTTEQVQGVSDGTFYLT